MKTIRSRILFGLIIVFFIAGASTSAKSLWDHIGVIPPETIAAPPMGLEENPVAVIFPENLRSYRSRAKEYVKNYGEKNRDFVIHSFLKGQKFFPKAQEILNKYRVPVELQMIPVLESDFDANAVSKVGAIGYWQFMTELAHEYGLHTTGKYDERKNFVKATIAASKYFRDQLQYYRGDILLAVASYNCGQGRVDKAIKQSGKVHAGFWDVKQYLPFETRKFVMDFISLNVIAANYDKFLADRMDFSATPFIAEAPGDNGLQQGGSKTVMAY
ncbi:MAG: lytic transglycosylase domain-containing protein [Bacteroidota bacterium]|nr:lytic transglycosylase domain-containing protein [Bacteroidota bacterium]